MTAVNYTATEGQTTATELETETEIIYWGPMPRPTALCCLIYDNVIKID